MHRFEVWAPRARKLELILGSEALRMQGSDDRGWWRLEVEQARCGADYGYRIDDDAKIYPDPRSIWQPEGVHSMSRVYNHASFVWSDGETHPPDFASGIIYELHVGTFTPQGTLDAAIDKLNYLVDLGVTHLELMPVASFSGNRGWGYDGVALYSVHQAYGGPDALKRFVNAAHQAGLAVLLDVVYNHFGPVGNYTGRYGPYLTDAHRTPWGDAVNFEDAGSCEVRRFYCDNALMWLRDYHLDGLRLDAVHAFVDRSAIHFLEQLSIEVEQLSSQINRKLILIAESDLNDPRIVTPHDRSGLGMDAQWSDDFHHALFAVLSNAPGQGYYADFGELAQLAKALEHNFVYDGLFSKYRDCIQGRPTGDLSQDRFVGFIQNHDQVGNRAIGDRLCEIVGFERAKIAAAVVLMSPFVPLLFQGEEWAASSPFLYFADHDDPEIAHAVSKGRKSEFQAFGWEPESIPDPEAKETFESSKLNWDELSYGTHEAMHAWYRELMRLRRASPSLHDSRPGNTHVAFDEQAKWFTIARGEIVIACNLGSNPQTIVVPHGKQIRLTSRAGLAITERSMTLLPDSLAIIG